jgi:hypothetical protein
MVRALNDGAKTQASNDIGEIREPVRNGCGLGNSSGASSYDGSAGDLNYAAQKPRTIATVACQYARGRLSRRDHCRRLCQKRPPERAPAIFESKPPPAAAPPPPRNGRFGPPISSPGTPFSSTSCPIVRPDWSSTGSLTPIGSLSPTPPLLPTAAERLLLTTDSLVLSNDDDVAPERMVVALMTVRIEVCGPSPARETPGPLPVSAWATPAPVVSAAPRPSAKALAPSQTDASACRGRARWRPLGPNDKSLVDALDALCLPAMRTPLSSPSIDAQYCREVTGAPVDQ